MKVHLVDGTYELFRSYYGAPSAVSSRRGEVGAVLGLLRSTIGLLQTPDVTHVAFAFDHVIESFRNDLFQGYKTGEGIEPELRNQFELAERAIEALGIVVWPMVEFETDDALATAAARFSGYDEVEEIVLASPDKDFAQCVRGRRIVMWDRVRQKYYDEDGVLKKWGVRPGSIPDWLALVGDDADGIPGIPRWGAKSSSAVLSQYGRLEDIPDDPAQWSVKVRGAATLAENLRLQRGDAYLYKKLATLREDVPLRESLSDLQWVGCPDQRLETLAETEFGPSVLSPSRVARWRKTLEDHRARV